MATPAEPASVQRGIRHPVLFAVFSHPGTAGALVQNGGTGLVEPNAGRAVLVDTVDTVCLPCGWWGSVISENCAME